MFFALAVIGRRTSAPVNVHFFRAAQKTNCSAAPRQRRSGK
jgi:hypothetical protein